MTAAQRNFGGRSGGRRIRGPIGVLQINSSPRIFACSHVPQFTDVYHWTIPDERQWSISGIIEPIKCVRTRIDIHRIDKRGKFIASVARIRVRSAGVVIPPVTDKAPPIPWITGCSAGNYCALVPRDIVNRSNLTGCGTRFLQEVASIAACFTPLRSRSANDDCGIVYTVVVCWSPSFVSDDFHGNVSRAKLRILIACYWNCERYTLGV